MENTEKKSNQQIKKCEYCKKEFESKSKSNIYCSKQCLDDSKKNKKHQCCQCKKIKAYCRKYNNGYICQACHRMENKQICALCGKHRAINARTEDGGYICSVCYQQGRKEQCSICGRMNVIGVRNTDGSATCSSCSHISKKEICSLCGKQSAVAIRNDDGSSIGFCCYRVVNTKECVNCGRKLVVVARDDHGGPICLNCWRKDSRERCSICGKINTVHTRENDGKSICDSCASERTRGPCEICSNIRPLSTRSCGYRTCKSCSLNLKIFDDDIEKVRKFRKGRKLIHHIAFEELFPQAISEFTTGGLIKRCNLEKTCSTKLRYDYLIDEDNILVELNEPTHYHLDAFMHRFGRYGKTEKDFNKYCKDFETKVQMAKKSGMKLIIIDVNYNMKYSEILDKIKLSMKNSPCLP